ncbi:hypothetical protein LTR85_008837 [Meristemomyces frigidus]|nr:hypothetical protein LTR85_008837 [Meristemomyces frigidus]
MATSPTIFPSKSLDPSNPRSTSPSPRASPDDKVSRSDTTQTGSLTIFDLPPEIRNAIYGYTLQEDTKVLPGTGKEPGLFKTCHQVREEALQMFYFINDLEFYIWPSQVFHSQTPAYRWAYYHIGGNTLQIGQVLSIKTATFEMELEQSKIDGRTGLTLKSLSFHGEMHHADADDPRKAVNEAFAFVFRNREMDMAAWLAHNVVQGLVQYLTVWRVGTYSAACGLLGNDRKAYGALSFNGGGHALGGKRETFAERW